MSDIIGTVKIIRVRFLEDECFAGSIPQKCYDAAVIENYEADDIEEAVRAITREGLTFSSTGSDWAGNPDGTVIVDYATAEREEVSAHLVGFSEADEIAITERVG
jgi:hypothetical protein